MVRDKSKMPRNRKGLLHIFDAASFSLSGFTRLSKESAFRLEFLWVVVGLTPLSSNSMPEQEVWTVYQP